MSDWCLILKIVKCAANVRCFADWGV